MQVWVIWRSHKIPEENSLNYKTTVHVEVWELLPTNSLEKEISSFSTSVLLNPTKKQTNQNQTKQQAHYVQ